MKIVVFASVFVLFSFYVFPQESTLKEKANRPAYYINGVFTNSVRINANDIDSIQIDKEKSITVDGVYYEGAVNIYSKFEPQWISIDQIREQEQLDGGNYLYMIDTEIIKEGDPEDIKIERNYIRKVEIEKIHYSDIVLIRIYTKSSTDEIRIR